MPKRKRSRSRDLKIKLLSGTEKQLKSLLRKAGYAVGELTNPGGVDMYAASLAPGIAERITRGAQRLVGRKRKRKVGAKRRRNPARRIYIRREKLDRGGYDSGGTYWGVGQPLFYYESEDGEVEVDGHIRADDAKHARLKVLKKHPELRIKITRAGKR